jgi:hypothetical protein
MKAKAHQMEEAQSREGVQAYDSLWFGLFVLQGERPFFNLLVCAHTRTPCSCSACKSI